MRLKLDYATFVFEKGVLRWGDISEKLSGGMPLKWVTAGISEHAPMVSPFGLRWMENNGFAERPLRLDVSGVGCRKFEGTLPVLRDAEKQHFSRLDFAFDVIMDRKAWREFICHAFQDSLESTRHYKKYSLSGSGEAMTIYIGARRGSKFFRIYNKTLEDSSYVPRDDEGREIMLEPSQCVVRYEVELKRHNVHRNGVKTIFDPSALFDWYYSSDPAEQAKLLEVIKDMWRKYCPAEYLPDLELLIVSKTKNFVQSSKAEIYETIKTGAHDSPHTFDHTLAYVVDKFAKYIPYILADEKMREECFAECQKAFGFEPEYYFETSKPSGWDDLEDIDEDGEEIPEQLLLEI